MDDPYYGAVLLIVGFLATAFLLALLTITCWAIIFTANIIDWLIRRLSRAALTVLCVALAACGAPAGMGQQSLYGASMDWRTSNSVSADAVEQIIKNGGRNE